jgi:long-chain acyl-CoA synthetase
MNMQALFSEERHIGAIFFKRVTELGDRSFIKVQRGARFNEISWREFGANVRSAIFALHALGLGRGERVAIIGENSVNWLCADLATLSGGFPNVIVSPALSDATLLKVLAHSSCRAAFVQNDTAVGRLLNLKGQLPRLEHMVVLDGRGSGLPLSLAFDEFLSLGSSDDDERFCALLQSLHPDDLATIMYTSGSTGEPKGVMRTQNNLLANITNGGPVPVSKPGELTVLVLSLNHLLGRFGFLKSAVTGRSTAVIEATEGAVDLETIHALAPTALTLVPRVLEKLWEKIVDQKGCRGESERLEELHERRRQDAAMTEPERLEFDNLRAALARATREALGGRIKYIAYGGAALSPRLLNLFHLMEVPLLGSYGITECGGVTLSGVDDTTLGSLGRPFANVELRIAEDGELLVRGPTVTPGYFMNPEATREAIDPDGWFHTGDFANIDESGCLFIVGRKKDIFNCSEGTNIYPGHIELLLEGDRFIRQAVLLGDHRPFIAALIVAERKQIAARVNKPDSALEEEEIREVIGARIRQINDGLESYEKIREFRILAADFPPDVRQVTVFQKIKVDRRAVEARYQELIGAIYSTGLRETAL